VTRKMAEWYRWTEDSLELQVLVQPRASRDEIAGLRGEHLRIRLAAPPADGKANQRLVRFLAETFSVPKNRVEILAGAASRAKRVRIQSPRSFPALILPPNSACLPRGRP
jgi:uncharacterized protein (TIGR00251 family)